MINQSKPLLLGGAALEKKDAQAGLAHRKHTSA
jgi:hypothetical protein